VYLRKQVTTADVLNQVVIFFKCTDADGNGSCWFGFADVFGVGVGMVDVAAITQHAGSLDRHEVMHMLLTTQRKQQSHASMIISMLIALDEDGDGTVSLQEFMVRLAADSCSRHYFVFWM